MPGKESIEPSSESYPGSAVERKHPHEFPEDVVRRLIEGHRIVSNSGTKGLILKFAKNELPPELQEEIEEEEREMPEEDRTEALAVKALKIYAPGDAEREYESLKDAQRIIDEDKSGRPLAKVPRAGGFYELKVGSDTSKFLNDNGAMIGADSKVGLIVMDYIEGEDLATLLYKEVLKRVNSEHNPYLENKGEIDNLDFPRLHRAVAATLGFEVPGARSRDDGERMFEEMEVKSANANKLFNALRKNGFVLPEEVLEQVKNSVEALHENDLYHNDLHERNILVRNGDLEHPQTYLIDFGMATQGAPARDDEHHYLRDESVAKRLDMLAESPEAEDRRRKNQKMADWEGLMVQVTEQPKWKEQYAVIERAVLKGDADQLENQFRGYATFDTELSMFLAALLKIYREHPEVQEKIGTFMKERARTLAKRGFALSEIRSWEEAVEK